MYQPLLDNDMPEQGETEDVAVVDVKGKREIRWYHYVGDLANIIKAFIGTNYLALAFGFSQAGLIPGIICLLLVAILTDHGCQLMVRCKHRLIRHICSLYPRFLNEDAIAVRIELEKTVGYGDLAQHVIGECGYHLIQIAVFLTQYLTCVQYFVFIGNSLHHIILDVYMEKNESAAINSSDIVTKSFERSALDADQDNKFPGIPDLRLLILTPFPILFFLVMIQKIRRLAPLSMIATFFLITGAFSVFVYLCAGFTVTSNYDLFKIYTLPIFFGQMTSAYEGIGCVLPIESSMDGNRQIFPKFLHMSVFFVWIILFAFGLLGYLRYGNKVEQLIVLSIVNMPKIATFIVNGLLIISVIFTFPLQAFPAWQIAESYLLFCNFRPKRSIITRQMTRAVTISESVHESVQNNENEPLLQQSLGIKIALIVSQVSCVGGRSVAVWKKNTLRIILLCSQVLLAILLRDAFAYIGAFAGAIGCSLLSFILPCVIHLKARWPQLKFIIVVKDILIISFSIIASLVTIIVLFYGIATHSIVVG